MISITDTVSDPRTVMVHLQDAAVTMRAMMRPWRPLAVAFGAGHCVAPEQQEDSQLEYEERDDHDLQLELS